MFRFLPATLAAVTALFICGCKHATPDNVAATVNGRTITYAELDKKYQSTFMSSTERPSDDQMAIQKLEVLRTLVDNEIMLQRAEKLGLMATDADVESKFAELKAPYTQEEFQRQLASTKMTVEDMKAAAQARPQHDRSYSSKRSPPISQFPIATSPISITPTRAASIFQSRRFTWRKFW